MKNVYREPEKKQSKLFTSETFGMTLILFSSISVLLLLLSDLLFGQQWFYTQFLFGVFGYFSFALLVALGYLGVIMVLGRRPSGDWKKISLISILLFLLVCLIHTITAQNIDTGFSSYLADCYGRGEDGLSSCTAGGALFGIFVYPVVKYLTSVGAYILYPALMVIVIFILFKVSVATAAKEVKSRAYSKNNDIAGYKEYPDDGFDFSNPPDMQPVKNKLYYGTGSGDFSSKTKRDAKNEKDRALNILYPSSDANRRSTPVTHGSMQDLSRMRTGDFSGRSYQAQADRTYGDASRELRSAPSCKQDDTMGREQFGRPADVSERRSIDRYAPQPKVFNHEEDVSSSRLSTSRLSSQDRYSQRSETDRLNINKSDIGRADFNSSTERVDTPEESAVQRQNPIQSAMESGRGRYSGDVKITPLTYDCENDKVMSAERSPFEGKWETAREEKTVRKEEPIVAASPERKPPLTKEEEVIKEEIKPSNVKKYNLNEEKKAIYIESDTQEAVMPAEEQRKKKDEAQADSEQMPLVEQTEYVGIPEMPIKYKYNNPPLMLYNDNPKKLGGYDESIAERSRIIEKTLENFGVPARVENVQKGPTITRYEISIPEGVTVSKVPPRASDLAMRLEVEAVRIEAPIPGKSLIGIEVPNKVKDKVGMKELLMEKDYQKCSPDALAIVLGEDVIGNPVITDLTKTPHLLVAGATGMGKSVFLNALIMSLITKYGPNDLRLVLVDPKQVEFTIYENLPHLLVNQIITEAPQCIALLDWAIDEMELRYKIFRSCFAQKIDEYNNSINPKTQKRMPKIVIIIDELGDLFSISPQIKHDIEDRIKRLTQKARAAGIHVVVATQRPDVTVITGVIKTNLPSRIAFKVINYADSNTILNDGGADKLLGNGDMIFKTSNSALLRRIQGAYVSKDEMLRVLQYVKENNACYYDENAKKYIDAKKASTATGGTGASVSFGGGEDDGGKDTMFNNIPLKNLKALKIVILKKQASISLLQRCLNIGYSTAGRMIDWMENMNYIAAFGGSKAREVLITMEEFENLYGEADID